MKDAFTEAAAGAGAVPIRARAGDIMFRPNDPCRGFIALTQGGIKVTLTSASGREIVLYRVRPGEICLQTFSCLVQGKTYAAEGVAEDDVEALLIPPAGFDRLMQESERFRVAVLNSVAGRFADFEHVVEALAFSGLEQRVASALLRLADGEGVVHATHEALAAEIGSAREAVSRQLGLFARDGLVELARGRVALKRCDALSRLAAPPL
ncbi:MAG: Crp/Fnr family transcriptional regulator [Hyphomonadaceae bacterium]|nr:Crp/Fnr family transcriptional regulator [Hyphomonadaceae bacterium]